MTFHSSLNPFYQVTIGPIYQLSRVGVLSYSISCHPTCHLSVYLLSILSSRPKSHNYNIAILVFERI